MKIKPYQYITIFLLSCMLVVSCKENDVVYNTDFEGKEFRTLTIALPLGKAKIPLYKTLKKEGNMDILDSLHVNEEGVIYVKYNYSQDLDWEDVNQIGMDDISKSMEFDIAGLLSEEQIEQIDNVSKILELFPDLGDKIPDNIDPADPDFDISDYLPEDISQYLPEDIPDLSDLFPDGIPSPPGGGIPPLPQTSAVSHKINRLANDNKGLIGYVYKDSIAIPVDASGVDNDHQISIDKVIIMQGELSIDIQLPDNMTGDITLEIPGLQNANGSPFKPIFKGLSSNTVKQVYNLEDCALVSPGDSIYIKYSLDLLYNLAKGAPKGKAKVDFTLKDVSPKSIFGYFGQESLEEKGDISFDFLDDLEMKQDFGFNNVLIGVNIKNGLGIPIGIQSDINMYHGNEELNSLVLNPEFNFTINPAQYNETDGKVTPSETSKTFTTSLSFQNGKYPDKLEFAIMGKINPTGPPQESNFVIKDNNTGLMSVDLAVEIPFNLKTGNYTRKDTIDFDFNDLVKDSEAISENIEEAEIRMIINNGLPFDVQLSVKAVDANGSEVDAIIKDQKINSGSDGKIITAVENDFPISLTQEQIRKFKDRNVKKLVIESGMNTYKNDYIVINEDAFLDIEVSFRAKVNISSKLFE